MPTKGAMGIHSHLKEEAGQMPHNTSVTYHCGKLSHRNTYTCKEGWKMLCLLWLPKCCANICKFRRKGTSIALE